MEGWVVGDTIELDDLMLISVWIVDAKGSVPKLAERKLAMLQNVQQLGNVYPTYSLQELKSKSAFSGYNWYCLIVKLPLNGGHLALRVGG